MSREAITREIDDVNVHRAQGITLFQDSCAFIYQRIDQAIDNLFFGNGMLLDARFCRPFAHVGFYFRINDGAAIFVILVPACAGLLAIASHFAELVF